MPDTDSAYVPTPAEIREELESLIVADLLGPAGGEHETLTAPRERVSARYLVGMLAPAGTVAVDPARHDGGGTEGDDASPDPADEDGQASQSTLFPSSFGLTFAVDPNETAIRVRASWGRYAKVTPEGGEGRVWQRYPAGDERTLPLADGIIESVAVSEDFPGVVLRGRCSRRPGAWLLSLFLVNQQHSPPTNKDEAWLFQPELVVEPVDGRAVFLGRGEAVPDGPSARDDEDRELDLLYRNDVEFAVGHGVAVHATTATHDSTRAIALRTVVIPCNEVARVEAPSAAEMPALASVVFDMKVLAETADGNFGRALGPLVDAYRVWIEAQRARIDDPAEQMGDLAETARHAVSRAEDAAARLAAGIALLQDPLAAEAFRFANRAMWQQRVRSVAIAERRRNAEVPFEALVEASDVPKQRTWRPFQLAFILINLPSLFDPTHPDRSRDAGLVDLLFFPTGGGKTEAYLGLTAFTLAVRRLQGIVAGYDGSEGLGVLMRYTLRLLTAQQFQRATTLICACEVIRRERVAAGDPRWGTTPFRIGMWVGSAVTPNYSSTAQQALNELHGIGGARAGRGADPVQITACPWCGTTRPAPRSDVHRWRTLVHCSDALGVCDFSGRRSPDEGIPVVTVDEEIYRLLPSVVIATVDKFAQLPWQGPLHTLFGRVERQCTRHGFRSADLDVISGREERDSHTRRGALPPATTVARGPLRPPDLIIQDELHLISGPLGTMVGLYESAIDHLASWQIGGVTVRPKVVASTATIRRASQQVHALFWRGVAVFPPQVLDTRDSFFARTRPVSSAAGRRYLGICAPGVRLKAVEARVFTTVLAAAQKVFERHGTRADAWMTMVGYFNALRELGGARRLLEDDVSNRLRRTDRKGLARRPRPELRELTSRIGSSDIPRILDDLGLPHVPDRPKGQARPLDVLLATNMISVGVDVPRLGLMVAIGQPKATAEYIQATSRVGRDASGPGLVLTVYNWARPRDLSHYEGFEHYHATFYRQVEALSVTPFAARALDRGLTGVLVALARQLRTTWNPLRAAGLVNVDDAVVREICDLLVARAEGVTGDTADGVRVREQLRQRLDAWRITRDIVGAPLAYRRVKDGSARPLLLEPGNTAWGLWTCPTSMREVEQDINVVLLEHDRSVDTSPPFERLPLLAVAASVQPTHEDDLEDELPEESRA
jgi:hypothetical protein